MLENSNIEGMKNMGNTWIIKLSKAVQNGEISKEEAHAIIQTLKPITRHKHYTNVDVTYEMLTSITDSKAYKRLPNKAMAWKRTLTESLQTSTRGSHLTKAALRARQYCEAVRIECKTWRSLS